MQNQPAEQRRQPGRGKEGHIDRSIKIDAAMQRRESRTGERGEGPEERRGGRKMAWSAGSKGDDRWKVHQLEKDKLELTTAHNQELCSLQSELTRLRSSVERGEAQREELHYQLTVSQRDATRAARLSKEKHTLTERVAELQQKVEELQKALDMTRASRAEDQNALRQEMDERDRLIQNFGSENQRLHKLLQDHEEALSKSERRMKELQKEREKNGEINRRQTEELKYLKEREQRSRRDKEASDQKVKSLESSVEAERAAHLESKFNSEIIQLRVRDLEAGLAVERSGQQEARCSLEMLRTQFREVEKAYNKTQHALERLQKEYEQCKSELSVALETEKKTTSDITERLEEERRAHTDTHTQLKQAADKAEALMKDMRETLRQHNSTATDPPAKNPLEILQLLQTTLNTWKLRLEAADTQVQDLLSSSEKLREENQNLLKLNSDQIRQIEDSQQAAIKLEQEVTRLGQESCDWSNLQTKMADERKEREREVKKKTEHYEQEEKARLSLLYCVYQRLIAGSVLLNPPQCKMGDFTWTELCDVINQQVDQLTSELREANDKNAHLQSVCENKSVCVRELQRSQAGVMARVEESVRKREEQWSQQHTHTVTQLNQELQRCVNECESVRVESACFLSACALLMGALTHTHGRLHSLCAQKRLLHTRLAHREHLEEEVRRLATALAGGEEENNNIEERRRALALRRWRRCVCVVRAVNRWRALTTDTPVLFRLDRGGGVCGERATATRKDGDSEGLCARWLCSKSLSSIILSATAQLQGTLATIGSSPSGVMSEARSALSRLLDHYIHQSEASSGLSLGRKTPPQTDLKVLVSGIHQHFLVFSERLHSTEVERRKLRLEVSNLKKGLKREREETIKRVPQQRFNSVCVELRQALNREQEAQTIIQEQTNEHNGMKHTLRQTEQEVSHKEESLRILGKHLSGVQRERQQLEQRLKKAQDQLTDADRRKHCLISNMKAAETSYKELRESLVQSRHSLSAKPRLPVELIGAESIMGNEVVALQSLLSSFSQLLQSCCSRIGWLEQEVSAHSSHVIALRKELQEVCLRDNQGYVPEVNTHSRELQDVCLRDNKELQQYGKNEAEFPKTPEPLPVRDVSKELSIILNSALFHTKPAPFVISPTPSLEQSIPQKKYRRGGDRQTRRK